LDRPVDSSGTKQKVSPLRFRPLSPPSVSPKH
jgi:hypothetical protein